MRIDITSTRTLQVQSWIKVTAYKKLSTKAIALLKALAKGDELTRPDLFRAAGYEANKRTSGNQPKTDLTDYRLFATGLLDMRATGVQGKFGYNGVQTYWKLNDKGRAALVAAVVAEVIKKVSARRKIKLDQSKFRATLKYQNRSKIDGQT